MCCVIIILSYCNVKKIILWSKKLIAKKTLLIHLNNAIYRLELNISKINYRLCNYEYEFIFINRKSIFNYLFEGLDTLVAISKHACICMKLLTYCWCFSGENLITYILN